MICPFKANGFKTATPTTSGQDVSGVRTAVAIEDIGENGPATTVAEAEERAVPEF